MESLEKSTLGEPTKKVIWEGSRAWTPEGAEKTTTEMIEHFYSILDQVKTHTAARIIKAALMEEMLHIALSTSLTEDDFRKVQIATNTSWADWETALNDSVDDRMRPHQINITAEEDDQNAMSRTMKRAGQE